MNGAWGVAVDWGRIRAYDLRMSSNTKIDTKIQGLPPVMGDPIQSLTPVTPCTPFNIVIHILEPFGISTAVGVINEFRFF
jgi:hypothetical protein